ncbi:hypothetical protein HYPSUDRAFT_47764 [Hypholoma sublateritium FD-334 SS-4]|uniref:Nucleolar protein 9 n=1 Tax=Hypholoma sublateritium (strain FD-334 SS-4) TaxID=945553 RepID=A0A0D2P6S8_HYPSF|nr:hypothetical protein HYPSUDRAFT_47764 [Hypholoma sublateritium FD-334 SS-4]
MPRENRKRGKKHKKLNEEEPEYKEYVEPEAESRGEPSWIVPATGQVEEINPEAPFGYVDADVKAYFRTVDIQIRDWQENQDETVQDGDVDPNEHKRMFFTAALQEMQKKEKQLATDPDCSVILERMSHSMDDFVRRVFVDSLAGSYDVLVRHRFASHVCQTLFTVGRDTISREAKGITPANTTSEEEGELRTLSQLVLDICEELLPTFSALVMDPFASHVVRTLLLLLSPNLSTSEEGSQSALRSKKSSAWKARQGQMKSVFTEDKGKGKDSVRRTPPEFQQMARKFVEVVREQLDENETRAMAANKVACPGLQMLLEVEADLDMSNEPDSLMDRVMVGVITTCLENSSADIDESDYVGTLLRDANSSHLLEIIATRCPNNAFNALWKTYFRGKMARLAAHPVANFVLAKALERVSEIQLSEIFEELDGTWNKLIRTSRTGVLRAVVDRASTLDSSGRQIIAAVYDAFNLETAEEKALVVPCALTLLPMAEYRAAITDREKYTAIQPPSHHGSRQAPQIADPLEPKTQGSILLQSLLRLPETLSSFITDSIHALTVEDRIRISHNASGSRVFDALLDSPKVPAKIKRQFVMDFIGYYHLLVDDKLGSRVGDRCWAFSDTYLKEKIARSLIHEEQTLAASYYGKFFARNLNLYLLQRKPEDWRNLQSERKRTQDEEKRKASAAAAAPSPVSAPQTEPAAPQSESRKRKSRPENEIDALFNEKLGKRIKKAALTDTKSVTAVAETPSVKKKKPDKDLDQVLGAIRLAPANDGKKKRH